MKCFYHSADLDGHCAGAIVRKKYPDCELTGIDYGAPFDMEAMEGEEIFMVDFSLQPYSLMRVLDRVAKRLVWLDHHVSAIEDHHYAVDRGAPEIHGIQLSGDAGCELTWKYLFAHQPMPLAVRLLGRYDVFKFEDYILALPFQYGMRLMETRPEMAPELWGQLLQDDPEAISEICAAGEICIKYHDQLTTKYARRNGIEVSFEGLSFVALNVGKPLVSSKLFESIYDRKVHDAMLGFCKMPTGWEVNMYTNKDHLDLAAIAKKHGGGGHKKAAGFQCRRLPFILRGQRER